MEDNDHTSIYESMQQVAAPNLNDLRGVKLEGLYYFTLSSGGK